MNCKEFERLIPAFVNKSMDFRTLKKFEEHRTTCKACDEELVIQFLVNEGIQRLEDGNAFDLQSELVERKEEAQYHVQLQYSFLRLGVLLEFLFFIVLAVFMIWLII